MELELSRTLWVMSLGILSFWQEDLHGRDLGRKGVNSPIVDRTDRSTESPQRKQPIAHTRTQATMALEFTDSNFEELVLKSDKPVLVDFWAEWCGPCRMVGPLVEELAKEYDGKAVVGKLNVDNNANTSMKYGIRSIPTLLVFKNGEIVDRAVGAVPKSTLAQKLDGQLA
jgi:thioredoxin 1